MFEPHEFNFWVAVAFSDQNFSTISSNQSSRRLPLPFPRWQRLLRRVLVWWGRCCVGVEGKEERMSPNERLVRKRSTGCVAKAHYQLIRFLTTVRSEAVLPVRWRRETPTYPDQLITNTNTRQTINPKHKTTEFLESSQRAIEQIETQKFFLVRSIGTNIKMYPRNSLSGNRNIM